MIDAWWLLVLLPLAAASGWWHAQYSRRRHAVARDTARIHAPPEYFKGLNYLLNDQSDKAIEIFLRMAQPTEEIAIETHLALGNLFRRRGEVERAIRIHENLIEQPHLSAEQRIHARLELGQDYMRAGLFDRAEALFIDLGTQEALRFLCDIYQQEREWHKAIDAAHRLEKATGESQQSIIAQFYCELAEKHLHQRNYPQVVEQLDIALQADTKCVRANLLRGRMAMEQGDYHGAINAYRGVAAQESEFIAEIVAPLLQCYRALGKAEEMTSYLKELLHRYGRRTQVQALAELLKQEHDEHRTTQLVIDYLSQQPSLAGLACLLELHLSRQTPLTTDDVAALKQIVDRLLTGLPAYRCESCGFSGRVLHWQCPGCKGWNTMRPMQDARLQTRAAA